jgi:diguanylate cyclase (GGDEF)-like protein
MVPAFVALAAMAASRIDSPWAPGWWDVAWTSAALSALVGMCLAAGAAPSSDRRRWKLWAAATAFWLIGQSLWDLFGVIGFPSSPNLADAGWWGFAVLVMASLLRNGSSSRSVRVVGLSETIPIVGAAVAFSVAALWHDASGSSLSMPARLSALAYPAVYIAAAVLMLQAMIGGTLRGTRSAALRLVLIGMASQAVGFSFWSQQLLQRAYVPGRTVLDPLWTLGLIAIAFGGLLAARRPEPTFEIKEPAKYGGILPAAMFAFLIVGLIRDQVAGAPAEVRVALAAGLLLCGVALIVRSVLLESRLRALLTRERAALGVLAERESELAALNARLVEDSRRDPLTGMRNRRALTDDVLALETVRQHSGRKFAVALCDVDHFKAYNDRLGHLAGDQALRTIAATIRGALRDGDIAYRFGGEELLLVLEAEDPVAATAAVERIRHAVARAPVPHPDGGEQELTISVGIAAGDEEFATLLARADAALYRAKRAGRNRTVAAGAQEATLDPATRHEPVQEPVPRHLRAMLEISRAAASGHGATAILEALAETIRSELSFHVVAVNLLDDAQQQLSCIIVLGNEEARETLLGTVNPWSEWEDLLTSEHQRCGAIWLPAGTEEPWQNTTLWTPPTRATTGVQDWHPDDMLLLPLRASDGEVLGIVSVDQPVSGRRPDDTDITVLMSVAEHAALGLEEMRRRDASRRTRQDSAQLRLAAVMLLAEALDLRDPRTAHHAHTVGEFARQIAAALGLTDEHAERIHAAGVLHDVGKLGIADTILLKPGPLEAPEWKEIQRHPEVGARILEHAGLSDVADWVRCHHERLDGDGYPSGLAGDEIPLEARILAVADAYEGMISERPYRRRLPADEACRELERCSGTQFDPVVVAALLGALEPETLPEPPAGREASGTPGAPGAQQRDPGSDLLVAGTVRSAGWGRG